MNLKDIFETKQTLDYIEFVLENTQEVDREIDEKLNIDLTLLQEGIKGVNAIVQKWAKEYNMSYEEVHKIWERAEKKAGKGNYPLIVHIFKRIFTSLKNVDARTVKTKTGGTFNYKVRTKQSLALAVVDEKPKRELEKTKKEIKKLNKKIKDITAKIKELKSKNPTELRKKKIKELQAQKKELQLKKDKLKEKQESLTKKIEELSKKALKSKKK